MQAPSPSQPLLITEISLITSPDSSILSNQWLLIEKSTIHSFGPMEQLPKRDDIFIIDGKGKMGIPGLINGHNHSAMTLFRGLADDLALNEWLTEHIFPAEAQHVNPDMVYWCSKLAAAEMILSGTTTVADGYFHEESAAQAFADCGLRAVAAQGVIDFPAPGVPDPTDNTAVAEAYIKKWKKENPLITPALFAHSPYTCSPATLKRAKAVTREHGVKFFIHTAESQYEQQMLLDPQGTSPVQHLASLDLLDEDTALIHCVWLDDKDRAVLHKSGAGVIVCPQSHTKLSSGLAAGTDMIQMGIPVGLGTDGCASNNSLDMFQEMDMLAKSQKLRTLDATALSARQALAAATTTNASILGLPQLGQIECGYTADLVLLDMQQPHLQPYYSSDFLTYNCSGSDVDTVIINGELVLQAREFLSLDLTETVTEVRNRARHLGAL